MIWRPALSLCVFLNKLEPNVKILLSVTLVLSALTVLLAAVTLIGGPTGIQAAGAGEMWSMHYGFAALAIASCSIWIWPHRSDLQAVTPILLTLLVFHAGVCLSLVLAGDQPVGAVIHATLTLLLIVLVFRRKSFAGG